MIDPKELRIGNHVHIGLHVRRVMSIDAKSSFNVGLDDDDLYGDDEINPIPITPEWLERLGFKKVKATIPFWSLEAHLLPMHWDSMSGLCLEASYDGGMASTDVEMDHIKYIHQLQNLYHALTGLELTYQEDK